MGQGFCLQLEARVTDMDFDGAVGDLETFAGLGCAEAARGVAQDGEFAFGEVCGQGGDLGWVRLWAACSGPKTG